jgi:hypothetical protein
MLFLIILKGKLGAVAHLGERVVRNDEVASSILVSSTNFSQSKPPTKMEVFIFVYQYEQRPWLLKLVGDLRG